MVAAVLGDSPTTQQQQLGSASELNQNSVLLFSCCRHIPLISITFLKFHVMLPVPRVCSTADHTVFPH